MTLIDVLKPAALYSQHADTIDGAHAWLMSVEFRGLRIDAYCPQCHQNTTYVLKPFGVKPSIPGTPRVREVLERFPKYLRRLEFECARDASHMYVTMIEMEALHAGAESPGPISGFRFMKVGQIPSLADLEVAKFRSYQKYVDDIDYLELKKASGLISHGIGIGSFVYLRRIFERQIDKARQSAATSPGWDANAFQRVRMDERIPMLKDHLPAFLVENAKLYGILSKGIHELGEEECLAAYDAVEMGILMILDDVKAAGQRAERAKQAAKSLERLHGQFKNK